LRLSCLIVTFAKCFGEGLSQEMSLLYGNNNQAPRRQSPMIGSGTSGVENGFDLCAIWSGFAEQLRRSVLS
jgi:hypothetical protein